MLQVWGYSAPPPGLRGKSEVASRRLPTYFHSNRCVVKVVMPAEAFEDANELVKQAEESLHPPSKSVRRRMGKEISPVHLVILS